MIDCEQELIQQNPDWALVLQAYRMDSGRAPADVAEHDGWLPRLATVDGVESDRLPRIHGKLIAMGLLKFQLGGRHDGVLYQLSHSGTQVLGLQTTDPVDVDESEPTELAQSA